MNSQGKLSADLIGSLLSFPGSDRQTAVESQITKYLDIAEKHWDRKFNRPDVKYDLKGHTGGWAIGGHTIRLNYDILTDDRYYQDMVNQTVPHELAHIVVHQMWPKASAHGEHWQHVMSVFGKPADRCHQYETKAVKKHKKFSYTCTCPGRTYELGSARHNRAQTGQRRYYCPLCQETLVWNGVQN